MERRARNDIELLLVEDDPLIGEHLGSVLKKASIGFHWARTQAQAKREIAGGGFKLVLCDYQLPDGTGNELLHWTRSMSHPPRFFLMSAFGTVARAVDAVKNGAEDFFEKPLNIPAVLRILKTELETLRTPRGAGKSSAPGLPETGIVCALGSPLEKSLELARVVASKHCSLYLRGESGTGKEVFARYIHGQGADRVRPFVAVNCAAISPQLIEAELFGSKKGAFTGAAEDRAGKFQQASGGTLFLDEIGDMPLDLQTKVLRVLQEKTVCPVGDSREIPVDFRLICATHRDLRMETEEGRFREDLFFRLNVVEITIPPLRDRPMDIPPLMRRFLGESLTAGEIEQAMGLVPLALLNHPFPGNVRELKNWVERYCALRELGKTWEDLLPGAAPSPHRERARPELPEAAGRIRNSFLPDTEILAALESCGYHRGKTSAMLGISRRALQYRLAKLGGAHAIK